MPIYEYLCPKEHRTERISLTYKDCPTVLPCPICGQPAPKQLSLPHPPHKFRWYKAEDYGKGKR